MAKDLRVKVRLTADTKQAQQSIKSAEGSFKKFGDFLSKRFVITLGDVSRAISTVFASIQASITLKRQETALRGQLAAMGQDFDSFIATLKRVSNNTVATSNLIAASSRALLLGIPAKEIADLLEIAASRAAATGDSVAKAFNDISIGIGRASPLILDNLGFTIKLEAAYEVLAGQLGKTALSLTNAEKKTALLNAVLREGKSTLDDFGDALNDTGTALDQTSASMKDFRDQGNDLIAAIGTGLAAALTRAVAGFVALGFTVTLVAKQFVDLASLIPGVGDRFDETSQSLLRTSVALQRKMNDLVKTANSLSSSADEQATKFLGLSSAQNLAGASADGLRQKMQQQRSAMKDAASRTAKLTAETKALALVQDEAASAAAKLGAALGEATSIELQGQIDAIRKDLVLTGDELGRNSDEFVRLERIATQKVDSLNQRILSLRDGLGDLMETTEQASFGMEELGGGFDVAGQRANRFGSDIDRLNGKLVQVSGTAQRFNVITRSGSGTSGQAPLFNSLDSNGLGAFQTRSTERVS